MRREGKKGERERERGIADVLLISIFWFFIAFYVPGECRNHSRFYVVHDVMTGNGISESETKKEEDDGEEEGE